MSLPTMHGVGRLTAAPELRFTTQGKAVATVPLAFNARRYDKDSGQWQDGDTLFLRGTVFGDHAENVTETFDRGSEVVVSGRLKTDQWEDRQSGEKRSATALLIDAIGASTRFATASIRKSDRRESAPAAEAPAPGWSSDEPPF